jgi:hypothetical protein
MSASAFSPASKLALLGGTPVGEVVYSKFPVFSEQAIARVGEVLRAGKAATTRELYYMHAAFFRDAKESGEAVARVAFEACEADAVLPLGLGDEDDEWRALVPADAPPLSSS